MTYTGYSQKSVPKHISSVKSAYRTFEKYSDEVGDDAHCQHKAPPCAAHEILLVVFTFAIFAHTGLPGGQQSLGVSNKDDARNQHQHLPQAVRNARHRHDAPRTPLFWSVLR